MTGCQYAATLNPMLTVWVHEVANEIDLGWYHLYAGTIVDLGMYSDVEISNVTVDFNGEIEIEIEY